jgi:hypothetical protein
MWSSIGLFLLALATSIVTVFGIVTALPLLYRQRFIGSLITNALNFIRSVLSPVYWVFRSGVLYLPFAKRIAQHAGDFIDRKFSAEKIQAWFDRRFENDDSMLVKGDRARAAAEVYGSEPFPWLWRRRSTISPDIRRPLIVDGKIAAGNLEIYSNISAKFCDSETVAGAFKFALIGAGFWSMIMFLFLLTLTSFLQLQTLSAIPAGARLSAPSKPAENFVYKDVWTQDERREVVADISRRFQMEGAAGTDVEGIKRKFAVVTSGHGLTTALAFFALLFMASFRALIMRACQEVAEPLSRSEKSSIVNNKYRTEDRRVADESYRFQLQTMDFDTSAMIEIGKTTGVFAHRLSLNGPEADVTLKYSLLDASTHTLIYGGTGTGKTRGVLLPMVRQLIELRGFEIAKGRPNRISFYVTDKKGTLACDVEKIAVAAGQEDSLRVVGTGPEDFGVDLLDTLNPRVLADVLTAGITQVYGTPSSGGADFWTRSASDAIRAFSILAWAFEHTQAGMEYADATDERPYSFSTIFQLAMSSANMAEDDTALVWQAITAVLDQFGWSHTSDPCLNHDVHEVEVLDAITFIRGGWTAMANETRTSVLAHINIALGGLVNTISLREAFGGAFRKRYETNKMIGIEDAWQHIMVVKIGDHGDAGRLVNIILKSLLFIEAQRREIRYNEIVSEYAKEDIIITEPLNMINNLFFVADEYQALATSGSSNSDVDFWNIARSTGVSGVVCSQSHQALEQSLGSVQAKNFINQFRSLICLTTEDIPTINHLKELSGKTLRSFTFRENNYESYQSLCAEIGDSPIMRGPFRFCQGDDMPAVCYALFDLLTVFQPEGIHFVKRPVFDVDYRFVKTPSFVMKDAESSFDKERDDLRSAVWRAEDKIEQYYEKGHSITDVLSQQDISLMGRAHAYVFLQRHGVVRQDIIRLPV